jgi:hypothetical protein
MQFIHACANGHYFQDDPHGRRIARTSQVPKSRLQRVKPHVFEGEGVFIFGGLARLGEGALNMDKGATDRDAHCFGDLPVCKAFEAKINRLSIPQNACDLRRRIFAALPKAVVYPFRFHGEYSVFCRLLTVKLVKSLCFSAMGRFFWPHD